MAVYSRTPLVRRLGIRPNERIVALNASDGYAALLDPLVDGTSVANGAHFIHLFLLEQQLVSLRTKLDEAGTL